MLTRKLRERVVEHVEVKNVLFFLATTGSLKLLHVYRSGNSALDSETGAALVQRRTRRSHTEARKVENAPNPAEPGHTVGG